MSDTNGKKIQSDYLVDKFGEGYGEEPYVYDDYLMNTFQRNPEFLEKNGQHYVGFDSDGTYLEFEDDADTDCVWIKAKDTDKYFYTTYNLINVWYKTKDEILKWNQKYEKYPKYKHKHLWKFTEI